VPDEHRRPLDALLGGADHGSGRTEQRRSDWLNHIFSPRKCSLPHAVRRESLSHVRRMCRCGRLWHAPRHDARQAGRRQHTHNANTSHEIFGQTADERERGQRQIEIGDPKESHSVLFPTFLQPHYQTLSVSSSVTNLANDGGRWAARLSLCHRSWRPTGLHLVVRSSTRLWRRWWSSVRSNLLRRPANRFSAGAGAVPSWAGRLRAPSSQAGERKAAALPALNELEDAWLAYRQGGCTGPPWSFRRG
jgi:hypothetical protein